MADDKDFHRTFDDLIASHGGEAAFTSVDLSIARTLAELMTAASEGGDPLRRAEAMSRLEGMLPVKSAVAARTPLDLSLLTADELDQFGELFAKATGAAPPPPPVERAPELSLEQQCRAAHWADLREFTDALLKDRELEFVPYGCA